MKNYTDQEKTEFFDANFKYIERILHVLQYSKKYMKAGTNMLEFLADWLERNYNN